MAGNGSDCGGEWEMSWGGKEAVAGYHSALAASGWLGVVSKWPRRPIVSVCRQWSGREVSQRWQSSCCTSRVVGC